MVKKTKSPIKFCAEIPNKMEFNSKTYITNDVPIDICDKNSFYQQDYVIYVTCTFFPTRKMQVFNHTGKFATPTMQLMATMFWSLCGPLYFICFHI